MTQRRILAPRTSHPSTSLRACLAPLLLALAACDVTGPDRSNRYAFDLQPENVVFSWPADRRPVRYFAPDVGPLRAYLQSGIEAWESQLLYGEFEGDVTGDSAGADVRVVISGGTPPPATLNGNPPVVACDGSTSAQLATPGQLRGPMTITVRWFTGFAPSDIANCLARVTAHEIGHSIGLFQHSPNPGDMMFGVPAVAAPSARDRSSVQFLYHTKATLLPAARP